MMRRVADNWMLRHSRFKGKCALHEEERKQEEYVDPLKRWVNGFECRTCWDNNDA
jgi:hypothetical protein